MSYNSGLNIDTEYQVDDKVVTTGPSIYHISTDTKVPFGTVGTIIRIRHRYKGTPNEYKQYKLSFPGYPEGDDVTNMYLVSALQKYE